MGLQELDLGPLGWGDAEGAAEREEFPGVEAGVRVEDVDGFGVAGWGG